MLVRNLDINFHFSATKKPQKLWFIVISGDFPDAYNPRDSRPTDDHNEAVGPMSDIKNCDALNACGEVVKSLELDG